MVKCGKILLISSFADIMAKEKEIKLAHHFYVKDGKTAKDISALIGVTEKTIGTWVNKYGWKQERDAVLFSAEAQISNIKQIISNCAEEHLLLSKQAIEADKAKDKELANSLREQMATLSDQVSKWNKTLENIDKTNQISLAVRLTVMRQIFEAMSNYDSKLFLQTIDFQEKYIHDISAAY